MHIRVKRKIFVFLSCAGIIAFSSAHNASAQEPAGLNNVDFKDLEYGLQLRLGHSKAPARYRVQEEKTPPKLTLYIEGAKITFRTYANIPIEIPVDEYGIKKIIFEEKIDHRQIPPRYVKVDIEMEQPFDYELDTQWGGKYINLTIVPQEMFAKRITLTERDIDFTPAMKLDIVQKIKDRKIQEERKHVEEVLEETRRHISEKETEERVEDIRRQAQERIEEGKLLEEAYKRLKAETEVSRLPSMREQIGERSLYEHITMPSQVKPMIKRIVSFSEVSTIEDCITVAFSNYAPLHIAKEQEKLAQLRQREARRAFYPGFLGEWREVDGTTVTEDYRGRSYGAQAQQPVFTGGKLTATLRKEQLGELIAKGNTQRVKNELILKVSKAFYEFIVAMRTYELLQELKIRQEQLLESVEKEFRIQSATPAVFLTAQSLYNQVCFQLASAEREFHLAKLNLEKEMYTENVKFTDLRYELKRKKIETSLDECRELAFRSRTEPRIIEMTIQSAKYGEDIIRSEEMPNVTIIGSYGRSGEAFSQRELNLATQWSVVGQVKWFLGGNTMETSYNQEKVSPYRVTKTDTNLSSRTYNAKFSFWDNLSHFTKQKEAQITKQQAEKELIEMRNKISQEIEDAYYSYRRYSTQLSLALNELGFRIKQLEIAKVRRAMNEATVPEVMEAEINLAQAMANQEQALAGIKAAIVSLNYAIGIIDYFH